MAQKRSPQDEILIQNLYEKLNWFTFEATDEEFDAEQVRTILELLDQLDPVDGTDAPTGSGVQGMPDTQEPGIQKVSNVQEAQAASGMQGVPDSQGTSTANYKPGDAAAAFERFKLRYNISEEELAAKDAQVTEAVRAAKNVYAGKSGEFAEDTTAGKVVSFPKKGIVEFSDELSFDGKQIDELPVKAGSQTSVEEDNAAVLSESKNRKKKRFASSAWGRITAGIAIVVLATLCLEFGTSAVAKKSFFEIVRDGVNGMKITVTGNETESESRAETETPVIGMESEERVYFDSWEEVKEEEPDILIPGYMPEGLELKELYREDVGERRTYAGVYTDSDEREAIIWVYNFTDIYKKIGFDDDNKVLKAEENGISIYQSENGNMYFALWKYGDSIYVVTWENYMEIRKIASNMK